MALAVAVLALGGLVGVFTGRPAPVKPRAPARPAAAAIVPGESDAQRIESIYYQQGPRPALDALKKDYVSAFGAASSPQAIRQLGDEVSRLKAHAATRTQFTPIVAIATEWCLEVHGPEDFPLRYDFLLAARDSDPAADRADVELGKDMVSVLQINWIAYANLTRSETRGYVADEHQIPIQSRSDLLKDQSEQEDFRLAIQKLRTKS